MRIIIKLPVIFTAIFMALMFIIDSIGLGYAVEVPGYSMLSITIFVIGILIIAIGSYSFRRANTTVNPMTPEQTTQLVKTGIYGYSRNPMYIGFLAWLVACVIYIGNTSNVFLLPFYVLLVNRLYILPEEMALEKLFNDEFRDYKKRVRRWI